MPTNGLSVPLRFESSLYGRMVNHRFSFSFRVFVSFVLFVAQIHCGRNGSHKGHEEHEGKTHSGLIK